MNAQPSPIIGTLLALGFLGLVFYYTFKEIRFPTRRTSYNKDILIPLPIVMIEEKIKPKVITKSNPHESDAILALHKLGFKKKDAILTVKDIINKYNPSTLEEILKIAFSKK